MAYQMTEKEGQKYALEHGTHALLNKVVKVEPCGCKPDGAGNLPSPVRVAFCTQHGKALKVIRQLKMLHECPKSGKRARRCSFCAILRIHGFMK